MIVSRTPFRISLFGGGTDYPAWFREHGGAVLGMAIDKYCYISVRRLPPFFEHRHRIVYSKVEMVREISEIQHPAVRGILTTMGFSEGLEIHHDGDLPARSGLGSSSSFTVGLLNALYALRGQMVTQEQLAKQAIQIEQDVLNESVGCQDQIWAAYGGLNRIDFRRSGDFIVTPIILPQNRRAELKQSMMLFFTGFSRFASDFAHSQLENVGKRQVELEAMQQLVDEALKVISGTTMSPRDLGLLLHESWELKRRLADNVSNPPLDAIYETGRRAGALGGKLLGAGGGGFMLFVVEPEERERVRNALKDFVHVNFDFDGQGSKIVIYQPNGL